MNPVVVLPQRKQLPPQYIPTEELPQTIPDEQMLRETIQLIVPALAAFSASAPGKLRKRRNEEDKDTEWK